MGFCRKHTLHAGRRYRDAQALLCCHPEGSAKQWQLVLRPVDSKIKSLVSEILIEGSFAQINTIEIREAGGDYSVMSISRDDS